MKHKIIFIFKIFSAKRTLHIWHEGNEFSVVYDDGFASCNFIKNSRNYKMTFFEYIK